MCRHVYTISKNQSYTIFPHGKNREQILAYFPQDNNNNNKNIFKSMARSKNKHTQNKGKDLEIILRFIELQKKENIK